MLLVGHHNSPRLNTRLHKVQLNCFEFSTSGGRHEVRLLKFTNGECCQVSPENNAMLNRPQEGHLFFRRGLALALIAFGCSRGLGCDPPFKSLLSCSMHFDMNKVLPRL